MKLVVESQWLKSDGNFVTYSIVCIGKTEEFEDQLRSILAQFNFTYKIHKF